MMMMVLLLLLLLWLLPLLLLLLPHLLLPPATAAAVARDCSTSADRRCRRHGLRPHHVRVQGPQYRRAVRREHAPQRAAAGQGCVTSRESHAFHGHTFCTDHHTHGWTHMLVHKSAQTGRGVTRCHQVWHNQGKHWHRVETQHIAPTVTQLLMWGAGGRGLLKIKRRSTVEDLGGWYSLRGTRMAHRTP